MTPADAPVSAPVDDAWQRGIEVERQQLAVLAGWATVNLAGGTAGWALADAPRTRAFHATNAAWNTVNLAIAGAGLLRRPAPPPSVDALTRQHRGLRTALAVNLALDAAYIGVGAGLWARGEPLGPIDGPGVGQALVVQGAFLAGFDAIFLARHQRRTR